MPSAGGQLPRQIGRAGLGERLGDREAEAAVVRHPGDEGALAGEIYGEHGGSIAERRRGGTPFRPSAYSPRSTSSGVRRITSRLLSSPTTTVSTTTPRTRNASGSGWGENRPSNTHLASAHAAAAESTAATAAAIAAEREVLGEHDPEELRAGGAQSPEQRALPDALEAAGRERADQDQGSGRQRERRHEADRQHDPVHQPLERLLHHRQVERGDVGEPLREAALERTRARPAARFG